MTEKDDERSFKNVTQSRNYNLIYVILFIALFIFVTVFLVGNDTDLYKEIIKIFAIFAGGFGGGYGVKTFMDRNN